jgi:hypothetical protein
MPTDSNFPPITRADYIALTAIKQGTYSAHSDSNAVRGHIAILRNRWFIAEEDGKLKLTARGQQAIEIYEAWRASEASRLARSLDEAMQHSSSTTPHRGWIITAFLIGFVSAAYLAIPLLLN